MLIDSQATILLVVDVQDRLLPHMADADRLLANVITLVTAARRMGVPILVSEQYPRGLGNTQGDLAAALADAPIVEKIHFSCLGDTTFAMKFREIGRRQVVIVGIEAHVCVLQTAIQFILDGLPVFVVADATGSRRRSDHACALDRLRDNGAQVVSTEMVVFEWLGKAGTNEFRELSTLIK